MANQTPQPKFIYTVPRPNVFTNPSVIFMALVLFFGMTSLSIAAFTAFVQVMHEWQAFFASVLIEANLVVEGLALVRTRLQKKESSVDAEGYSIVVNKIDWSAVSNWIIYAIALSISLIVSATYNYIQVNRAGALSGVTDWWQLFTLAIGPVAAMLFLSLSFGTQIRVHEDKVLEWETTRQKQYEKWEKQQERRADKVVVASEPEITKPVSLVDRVLHRQSGMTKTRSGLPASLMTSTVQEQTQEDLPVPESNDNPDRPVPAFKGGADGFREYLSWLQSRQEVFSKEQAEKDLKVTRRSIDRYIMSTGGDQK